MSQDGKWRTLSCLRFSPEVHRAPGRAYAQPVIRDVSTHMVLEADGAARIALAIAVDCAAQRESLEVVQDGKHLETDWLEDPSGTRFEVVNVRAGKVEVDYTARIEGRTGPTQVSTLDQLIYLRPSRYCESDTLSPIANAEFEGLSGHALVEAISSWVGTHLSYVPGSSLSTDGAVATLLARRGVCRDYAHLTVAMLRAMQMPARVAAVYAPGLKPMDFHAVAEAAIDGLWRVVDPTTLAPRLSMLRIATGRDASDIAFVDTSGANVSLLELKVMATADELPPDDLTEFVSLG